ncbi:MAG TPA: hypothetical protein VLV54_15865 [Thermoanaerobaculia bacterium]|nr:hypothetical protein [Thermoanaerobaculia bacterium]
MRKLIFIFALLCCSTQAMATLCTDLAGQCLKIPWGGATRVIGPIDYFSSLPFTYEASDTLLTGVSHVQGVCVNTSIGVDVFAFGNIVQSLFGTLTPPAMAGAPVTVTKGTFTSGNSQKLPWTAVVASCSAQLSQACVQCGVEVNECIAQAAPNQKPGCVAEYKLCKKENNCK